jgi:hypothetical protein
VSLPSFYVPSNFLTIARRRRRRPHSFATRLANYITRQFRQFGAAAQRHRVPDFGAQSLKDIQRALLSTACKPPKNGTPDSDCLRAQRERRDDIRSPSNAAIDDDGNPTLKGVYNRRQHVDCRRSSVKLASTMIGHEDCGDALLGGKAAIFGVTDTLENHRQPRAGA